MAIELTPASDATEESTERWKSTTGSAHVRPLPGPQTQAHNRELAGVSAPTAETVVATDLNTETWVAAENITEVTVTVTSGGAVVPTTEDGIWICFDATSDALASAWLSPGSAGTDTNRYFVPVNVPRVFRFTSNITRADCIANFNGTTSIDLDVVLEAN